MNRFSVFYPTTEGATFDHDYDRDKHVPLVKKTWGVERAEIDKGVDGPYVAAVHLIFESMDAVGAAMGNPGRDVTMSPIHSLVPTNLFSQVASLRQSARCPLGSPIP